MSAGPTIIQMQLRCIPHPRLHRAAETGALCGASTAAAHQSGRAGQLQIPETLGPGVDYISQRPARPQSSNPPPLQPRLPCEFQPAAGLLCLALRLGAELFGAESPRVTRSLHEAWRKPEGGERRGQAGGHGGLWRPQLGLP